MSKPRVTTDEQCYVARIVLTRTGTMVDAVQDLYEGSTPESLQWFWTDGNFGCDCNRGMEFRRALYPNPPAENPHWNGHAQIRCGFGQKSRYRVPYLLMPNGEKLPIDEET